MRPIDSARAKCDERSAARRLAAHLWAMMRQRCPRCHAGRIFRKGLTMNDPCPVCGLVFQREEGYFLGAMYTSYFLASAVLTGIFFALAALLPNWNGIALALLAAVPFLPLVPALFRYSRVTWIYFDRAVCPTEVSAGAYEKMRQGQVPGDRNNGSADRP